jgi:DNA-binding MarR family transcriptional regulator
MNIGTEKVYRKEILLVLEGRGFVHEDLLAREVLLALSTLTKLLEEMHKEGLIRRIVNAKDSSCHWAISA